jgi:hypothetical protein
VRRSRRLGYQDSLGSPWFTLSGYPVYLPWRLVYYAFDLLWRDGDLRKLPQIERKQRLLDLIGKNDRDAGDLFGASHVSRAGDV